MKEVGYAITALAVIVAFVLPWAVGVWVLIERLLNG